MGIKRKSKKDDVFESLSTLYEDAKNSHKKVEQVVQWIRSVEAQCHTVSISVEEITRCLAQIDEKIDGLNFEKALCNKNIELIKEMKSSRRGTACLKKFENSLKENKQVGFESLSVCVRDDAFAAQIELNMSLKGLLNRTKRDLTEKSGTSTATQSETPTKTNPNGDGK